jgi:glyoxylase-like metal-dependent hydrolase (beta-lactamase superfamily II)
VNSGTVELRDGIRRVTLALPLGIDHVHCYLLRTSDGAWTLVDTGLGTRDAAERWRPVLRGLDGPVGRIVITHYHPDHVGGAAILSELTGAPVLQGSEDYAQAVRVWGAGRSPERYVAFLRGHGMPAADVAELRAETDALARCVQLASDPEPLGPGLALDGWEVLHLPGHADGHMCLLRDGVLIAGDALLATISPNVGIYPESRPDPLGDYLASLARIVDLAPAVAFAGHNEPIEDPVGRARELIAHHEERLVRALEAAANGPRSAYEVSLALFPDALSPVLRRFALAEAGAHLEYLARRGHVRRAMDGERTLYDGA